MGFKKGFNKNYLFLAAWKKQGLLKLVYKPHLNREL